MQSEIKSKTGDAVKEIVDPFYQKHESTGKARDTDLFFLAFEKDQLVGCVRFCIEENTPLLRTMMVDEQFRKQKIGSRLLVAFENYLIDNEIKNTYCIPYAHLEKFYGQIGFKRLTDEEMPKFLLERLQKYRSQGKAYFCMKRP